LYQPSTHSHHFYEKFSSIFDEISRLPTHFTKDTTAFPQTLTEDA